MRVAEEVTNPVKTVRARRMVEEMPEYHPPLAGREALRLDFNENTFAPSPRVLERLRRVTAEELTKYPEREPAERALARHFGLVGEQVVLTNGVDEAIHLVCCAFLEEGDEALIATPTFFHVRRQCRDDDAGTGEGAGGCDTPVSDGAFSGGDHGADQADHGGFAEQSDGSDGEPGGSAADCGGCSGGGADGG